MLTLSFGNSVSNFPALCRLQRGVSATDVATRCRLAYWARPDLKLTRAKGKAGCGAAESAQRLFGPDPQRGAKYPGSGGEASLPMRAAEPVRLIHGEA